MAKKKEEKGKLTTSLETPAVEEKDTLSETGTETASEAVTSDEDQGALDAVSGTDLKSDPDAKGSAVPEEDASTGKTSGSQTESDTGSSAAGDTLPNDADQLSSSGDAPLSKTDKETKERSSPSGGDLSENRFGKDKSADSEGSAPAEAELPSKSVLPPGENGAAIADPDEIPSRTLNNLLTGSTLNSGNSDADDADGNPAAGRTRKTRKKSGSDTEGDNDESDVDVTSTTGSGDSDTDDFIADTSSEPPAPGSDPPGTVAPQPKRTPRRTRRRANQIVAIDEERSVETDEDIFKNNMLDLYESMKSRKILTGTIQGVEQPPDNTQLSFAVVYHGELKVIIPADQAVELPEDTRGRTPNEALHNMLNKRLGAEVDYIVKGIDQETGIAAASRLEAMALKRREYYFGTDRDGNNLIYEDISAEARVISVIQTGIFVDMFGLETFVPLREISYQRLVDATAHYQPGHRVLVKVLKLDRTDKNDIKITVSVKQAGENPYEKALRKYSEGNRYVGTVSVVDTNGVFVNLEGGVDCLCPYPKRGRPPRGARVTVRILGINKENNRIWGAITHITTAY